MQDCMRVFEKFLNSQCAKADKGSAVVDFSLAMSNLTFVSRSTSLPRGAVRIVESPISENVLSEEELSYRAKRLLLPGIGVKVLQSTRHSDLNSPLLG